MGKTIRDIAKLSNVSIATVSKIINGKDSNISDATRRRVKKIMKEQNYTPNPIARTLVTKRSDTLGIIVPDIGNPFFSQLIRAVEDFSNSRGYHLIILDTDDDIEKQKTCLQIMQKKMVDGIILVSSSFRFGESELLPFHSPVVLVDGNDEKRYFIGKVGIDNTYGGYIATKHLIEKGCKKIAFLSGGKHSGSTKERYVGYQKALKENNIPSSDGVCLFGKFTSEFGYEATKKMLENRLEIDGIFAGSDLIALGVMKALEEYEFSVPDKIKLIGFDAIYVSRYLSPALTTIRQPIYDIGKLASEMLIEYIENGKIEENTLLLDTELIERETT